MRPATRASSPRHPDPPANPRSTLPYPTCGRLQKPPTGYQSLTRPATGISRPPIASYLPPHLGSKMTKARTATLSATGLLAVLLHKLGQPTSLHRSHNLAAMEKARRELGRLTPVLVLDEAQQYPAGALEEIRL